MGITLEKLVVSQGPFLLSADMSLASGSRTAVIGPSGGGKSTLLAAIAGFADVSSGRVVINDHDYTTAPPSQRPVSLLFQANNLFPHLTVWQNVALALKTNLRLDDRDRAKIDAALADVSLDGMGERYPAQLSGGQQQRAALARALLRDKPVLLLDEPFAALGPALRTDMLDLVQRLTHGTGATVVMVTHSPSDAQHFCAFTVYLEDGLAHAPAPTAELFTKPPDPLAAYLGQKRAP